MAILLIDSKDNAFLNLLVELVKKVKGAKAQYIDDDENLEELDDKAFLEEMISSSKSGVLSSKETEHFIDKLKKAAQ
ncbi:MAG: hypothetical protein DSY76_08065 [Bacteroidetes bacterium]|nr:MAG: hypothetical protein DSY76_08065 [Bacteroidota bacterium]